MNTNIEALLKTCPRCCALPGMKCRNDNGDELPYLHLMRIEKAREEVSA